jgi:predicted metal-dependent phosphoesterase TrpH
LGYNHRGGIDLHIHTTASDGSLTPAQILSLACELRLGAIAITDHDTIEGSREALQIGIPSDIDFTTGVEISAAYPPFLRGSGSFHILAYAFRLEDSQLSGTLDTLRQARLNRNPKIVARLRDLGLDVSIDDIRKVAGDVQIGRPHIAQVLIKKGYARSIDQAFDKFLGNGRPAYVDKHRISCGQAIELIIQAGGIPVLAHPGLLKIADEHQFEQLIRNLMDIGLQGIEAYYPEHQPGQIQQYRKLAKRYRLLVTGGTDFHGDFSPQIKLGSGKGQLHIPYALYENLVGRSANSKLPRVPLG